jgi:hypothetical protein
VGDLGCDVKGERDVPSPLLMWCCQQWSVFTLHCLIELLFCPVSYPAQCTHISMFCLSTRDMVTRALDNGWEDRREKCRTAKAPSRHGPQLHVVRSAEYGKWLGDCRNR